MSNKDAINAAMIGSTDKDIETISAAGHELASKKNGQDLHSSIVENAIKVTGSNAGCLIVFDEKTEVCRLAETIGYPEKTDVSDTWELNPGGLTEDLLDAEGPIFIADVNNESSFDIPGMQETVSVLAAALKEADEVIGFLLVGDFRTRQYLDREIALFKAFVGQASLAMQKAALLEKNEELTVTDALTGLSNSRHFFNALNRETRRTQRYGGYFSVLLMDLDNLSHVNDCFGRTKGDWAIKKVAETIVTCSRQTDYKARCDGDEFAMILPSTSCQQASVLANRIRRAVNDISIGDGDERMRLSVSIGIAEFPCLGTNCDDLLGAVNTALAICKRRGRNLVCCYEDAPVEAGSLS